MSVPAEIPLFISSKTAIATHLSPKWRSKIYHNFSMKCVNISMKLILHAYRTSTPCIHPNVPVMHHFPNLKQSNKFIINTKQHNFGDKLAKHRPASNNSLA